MFCSCPCDQEMRLISYVRYYLHLHGGAEECVFKHTHSSSHFVNDLQQSEPNEIYEEPEEEKMPCTVINKT
jgi:hypothetical protein